MTKQDDTAAAEMLEHITQAAHKGGYQIAVLAVKESSQGKQFSFNYEGVAGKPCKLLEQLFKELVTGPADITSHIHESTTADYTTESAMQDTSTAVSLEAMDRSECLRDADKLDLLLDIASLIDANRAGRRRGDDPMNKQSASKQSMTARHSDVSNSPANNSLLSNLSHAEQHQTLADETLPDTINIPVTDPRSRRTVSSHTKRDVSDTTVDTAADQVVMDVSCLNVDRSIPKVSGNKYTSQLYGETGIQTPDDYYPAMRDMTTTETAAATETVSGLPADLIKMEPGCNIDEFNESLSQSYLEPPISKYGQGASNQLDNKLSSSSDELSNTEGGGAGNKLRSRSECISTIETTSRHEKDVTTSKRPAASITDGSSDSNEDEVHRDSQPSHKPSGRTQSRPISTDPGEQPYSPTTNRSKRKKRSRLSSQLSGSKTPENKPFLEHARDDDPLDRPVTLRDIYALTNEIRLMRATVNSIDHNINRMNVTKEIPTALMTLPYFTSYEEMETWKPDDTEAVILNIVRIGGENYKKAASYALDKMIPLEIQEELNVHGHGTMGKLAFNKTEVYRVIVAALTSQFNESEISISKAIGRHLVHAGSKLKTKKKKVLKDQ